MADHQTSYLAIMDGAGWFPEAFEMMPEELRFFFERQGAHEGYRVGFITIAAWRFVPGRGFACQQIMLSHEFAADTEAGPLAYIEDEVQAGFARLIRAEARP